MRFHSKKEGCRSDARRTHRGVDRKLRNVWTRLAEERRPEGVPQGVIRPNAKGFGDCLCRSYLAAVAASVLAIEIFKTSPGPFEVSPRHGRLTNEQSPGRSPRMRWPARARLPRDSDEISGRRTVQ
jgi:hypothetical protein